jgi:DNA excision repair protein ERCC-2
LPSAVREVFENVKIVPRLGQLEVAEKLSELLSQSARILFTAPPGWGKTLTTLAVLVASDTLPALWLTRSLSIGERVAEDGTLLGLHAFIAAGREKTCLLWPEIGDTHDFCHFARHKCPYYRLPREVPPAGDWRELVEKARSEKFCAYYAQDIVDAHVVVQNYYKRRPARALRALVVDEAHNLLDVSERSFTIAHVAEAIAVLRAHASERLARGAEALLRYCLTKAEGDLDAKLFIHEEGLLELRQIYYTLLLEDAKRAQALRPLILISGNPAYISEERITVYRPALPLYIRAFRPTILLTATPLPLLSTALDIEAEVRVPWSKKFPAALVTDVTTRFEDFDREMAARYKRLLIALARKYPRIIAFATERVIKEIRWLATYEERIPPEGWHGILALKYRGRFSEGVNLPADAVALLGAPFLPPEVSARLERFYRAFTDDAARLARDAPMLSTVVQSVGRAWRDPSTKPPTVILADERFRRYAELKEFMEIVDEKDSASL